MKSKKLISLLLAGAMTLPFAFWTASAEDTTVLVHENFAENVDGYVVNGLKDTSAANPVLNTSVDHTGDGSGALEYGLWFGCGR